MIRHPIGVTVLALAGAVLTTAAPLAQAQDTNPYRTSVTFDTAKFKTREGAETIYSELYKAAQIVCDTQEAGPRWRENDDRACESQAVSDAVSDLQQSQLYLVHQDMNADPDRMARFLSQEKDKK